MSNQWQLDYEYEAYEKACKDNNTDEPTTEQVTKAYEDIMSSIADEASDYYEGWKENE